MSYSEIVGRLAACQTKHKEIRALAMDRIRLTYYEIERYLEDKKKGLEPQDTILLEAIDRLQYLYGYLEEQP